MELTLHLNMLMNRIIISLMAIIYINGEDRNWRTAKHISQEEHKKH